MFTFPSARLRIRLADSHANVPFGICLNRGEMAVEQKKSYQSPTLVTREILSDVTAQAKMSPVRT